MRSHPQRVECRVLEMRSGLYQVLPLQTLQPELLVWCIPRLTGALEASERTSG